MRLQVGPCAHSPTEESCLDLPLVLHSPRNHQIGQPNHDLEVRTDDVKVRRVVIVSINLYLEPTDASDRNQRRTLQLVHHMHHSSIKINAYQCV